MCMAYFSGSGYSPLFTARMTEAIRQVREGATVTITQGADDLCAVCPNHTPQGCSMGENPEVYDEIVLQRAGLTVGQTLPASEFFAAVRTGVPLPQCRAEICGHCRWSILCTPDKLNIL